LKYEGLWEACWEETVERFVNRRGTRWNWLIGDNQRKISPKRRCLRFLEATGSSGLGRVPRGTLVGFLWGKCDIPPLSKDG
jgi:hypothetical protein